jgi:hypothetical protein
VGANNRPRINSAAGGFTVGSAISLASDGGAADGAIAFYALSGATNAELVPRVSITSGGNVGIGTTTADAKLTLAGDISFNSDYIIRRNTSDGSDNGRVALAGGGSDSNTRGAYMHIFGNEGGAAGSIQIRLGNAAPATFGIYRSNAALAFHINGADGNASFTGSGGTCTITGAGACSSDERLKTNIVEISGAEALDKLAVIQGITYNWADPSWDQSQKVGVVAQDVQKAFPQLVSTAPMKFKGIEDEYYLVDSASLTAPLISAVNELNNRVQELDSENDRLKAENEALKARLEALEAKVSGSEKSEVGSGK